MNQGESKRFTGRRRELPLASSAADRDRRDGPQVRCRGCGAERTAAHHRRRRKAPGATVREKAYVPTGHELRPRCGAAPPHGAWHRGATAPGGSSTRCTASRAAEGRWGLPEHRCGTTEARRGEPIASRQGLRVIRPKRSAVHVDHCHTTGRVPGVLCFNCNSAIGKLGDDPDAVRRAAAYLEGNSWKPTLVAPGVYLLPS
ncbi:endonuclease domain-containing protein [Streptomyces sp. NPDC002004]